MTRASRQFWLCRRDGSVLVEYGMVLPVLLLFLLGMLDTGRLLWTYTTLNRAVELSARCGAVDTTRCSTTTAVRNVAVTEAWGLQITAAAFTATAEACGMSVRGTYDFTFIIPWLVVPVPYGDANTIRLTARACFPL
jgi:Flp pilus assembly protein TadG